MERDGAWIRAGVLVVAVIAAAGAGAWVAGRGDAAPAVAGATVSEDELVELQRALERESLARQLLEERVAFLEELQDGGDGAADAWRPEATRRDGEPLAEPVEGEGDAGAGAAAAAAGEDEDEAAPWFDEAALIAAGVDPSEVEQLRRLWEEHQLEKAYLRDEATREGWARSRRHFREQVALERAFREDLGDEVYDRVLYATGKRNRAVVRDTLSRSAAREAGLEPGDVVWRYDGDLVLHPRDLQRATASGVSGELVPVDVIRGGERVRLYVRRGPLGALLERKKISPDA